MKEIVKEIKFALESIKQNIKSSAELRASFLTSLFGMMINNSAFLVIWMSFGNLAGNMGGWQTIDYLLSYGMVALSFGVCYGFFAGIRYLPEIVRFGDLDKFLLSPKNVLLRISVSKFEASAIGDLAFGMICVSAWVFITGNSSIFTLLNILFFTLSASLIFFFYGVAANSLAFYFADSRIIIQGVWEMLLTPAIFYGGAFQGIIKNVFIFIVPAMLLGNLPLEIIKHPTLNMYLLTVGITFFWIVFSIYIFYKSIRKYESSNFINFG